MMSVVNIHVINPMGKFGSAARAFMPGFAGKQRQQDHARHRHTNRNANHSADKFVAHSNISANAPRGVK